MENFKTLVVGTAAAMAAYFHPLSGVLFSLFYLFLLNLFFGIVTGIAVGREGFRFKKALNCMKEAGVYFIIVGSIYFVGEKMGNPDGALQCVTAVTYAFIYFYTVNILKNLRRLFPASRSLSFVHYVVGMEFVRKIPFLNGFLEQEKQEEVRP